MSLPFSKSTTGQDEFWPVVCLLAVVAIPTLAVLWFVSVAVQNQQLASKQRLSDAYGSNLETVKQNLLQQWTKWETIAREIDSTDEPRGQFLAFLHAAPEVRSVVCWGDEATAAYPSQESPTPSDHRKDVRWIRARKQESRPGDIGTAVALSLYRAIADETSDPLEYALAVQAQVRCDMRLGETQSALETVYAALQQPHAESPSTIPVLANIQMLLLDHLRSGPDFEKIWQNLHAQVFVDSTSHLSSSQRLFLMRRMTALRSNESDLAMLQTEDLAARWLQSKPVNMKPQRLASSSVSGIWHTPVAGRFVLLFGQFELERLVKDVSTTTALPPGVRVTLAPPAESVVAPGLVAVAMGETMPGWQLVLSYENEVGERLANQRAHLHIWTAAIVVLFTTVLGLVIARNLQHRLRLANLKNSLVGTVSHELKTPLASMRLLVETLLDEEQPDDKTTKEYLQLIDKENQRLSRLIDNFLSFSKMERGKQQFHFEEVRVSDVVEEAVQAIGERLQPPHCHFECQVAGSIPSLWADRDAIVTVLVNLLDNAWKHSGHSESTSSSSTDQPLRRIELSVSESGGRVNMHVTDNGIGLSKADQRRVFERFFQADQQLARQAQGCGLGLSIVQSIVQAHGGNVDVKSELGSGSEFIVSLPAEPGGGRL